MAYIFDEDLSDGILAGIMDVDKISNAEELAAWLKHEREELRVTESRIKVALATMMAIRKHNGQQHIVDVFLPELGESFSVRFQYPARL